MTMRAVWWLLKLGWRVATRARWALGFLPSPRIMPAPDPRPRAAALIGALEEEAPGRVLHGALKAALIGDANARWSMGGQLDVDERPPRANLADWLVRSSQPPDVVAEIVAVAKIYEETFCGACGAGPDNPTARCPACMTTFEALVARSTNDELGKLRELVKRGVL
jgi:hypothetical protein